jgi:hypothetical protein
VFNKCETEYNIKYIIPDGKHKILTEFHLGANNIAKKSTLAQNSIATKNNSTILTAR